MSTRIKKTAGYRLHRPFRKHRRRHACVAYKFGKLLELSADNLVVYNVTLVRPGRQRLMRTWFRSPLDAVVHAQFLVMRYKRIWGLHE